MENSGATNEKAAKLWGLSAANAARAERHAADPPGAYDRRQGSDSDLEKRFLLREAELEQELAVMKTRVSELQVRCGYGQQRASAGNSQSMWLSYPHIYLENTLQFLIS